MDNTFLPIQFIENKLVLLDQRKLPLEEVFNEYEDFIDGFHAIKDMVVRGAPCIGFTAIFTMALWLRENKEFTEEDLLSAGDFLNSARPTAINLGFEISRVTKIILACKNSGTNSFEAVVKLGQTQIIESETKNRQMAQFAENDLASKLNKSNYRILTHCNTGFLACGSIGTALGVVQHLFEKDKIESVWVDETRPYLQGSRLTAYELNKLGVKHKIVVEGAASHLMQNGLVDAIFTGADRIVANGDTANKVGTSNLAIIAKHYNIPFYIVAPSSSFDMNISTGDGIEVELRDADEILSYQGKRIAPLESTAFNPSFDVTRGSIITGIINENGIALGNYKQTLPGIM